jgi:hypothetical protein
MQGTIDLSGEAHRPFLIERQTIHHRACLHIQIVRENLVFLYCPFEAETAIVSPLGYR